jgi:hypothetical protein
MAKSTRELTEQERYPDQFFTSSKGKVRDRIIIHESSKIPREGQFVSLNGVAFLIKPGHEIDLPRPVRLMLDTLVETETIQQDDGQGGMKDHTRNIPRITYTMVKEGSNLPPPEVVESAKTTIKEKESKTEEDF